MGEQAVFTTPDVGRVFLACYHCDRTIPHYHMYGSVHIKGIGHCKCGSAMVRPTRLPEWKAAWWVLVVGWLWRKTIKRAAQWDPRMPVRHA